METFVLRIWVPAQLGSRPQPEQEIHGILEQVGAVTAVPFRDAEQLVHLIHAGISAARQRQD